MGISSSDDMAIYLHLQSTITIRILLLNNTTRLFSSGIQELKNANPSIKIEEVIYRNHKTLHSSMRKFLLKLTKKTVTASTRAVNLRSDLL